MSERTTIGGTVYESIGSSNSNLLLKCNGTARIQWGNKLIDLIKNGKLASEDSSVQVSIISKESEIKTDGIYILDEEKPQLLINKKGKTYNLTDVDLYISASNKQEITVEQKQQALINIGLYYDTITDLINANVQNGFAFVLENNTLYTINNGNISEFEAKVQTVAVENAETSKNDISQNDYGDQINGSVQIILSVANEKYVILSDDQIEVKKPIILENDVYISSKNYTENYGYKLYMEEETSYLDVDKINVRQGLIITNYIQLTFSKLLESINNNSLEPHKWYLISDFQNHWKLPANSIDFNRPILVRALTSNSLYKEGCLFKNQNIKIHYDITYQDHINLINSTTEMTISARGKITWMKDENNNEANFDFLDYTGHNGEALTTLHNGSIFPENSYNNKIIINNLKGTCVSNGQIDENVGNIISLNCEIMHDNIIYCNNFKIHTNYFYNNSFDYIDTICKVKIKNSESESEPETESNLITTINVDITNCNFKNVTGCYFSDPLDNVKFNNLNNCIFGLSPEFIRNVETGKIDIILTNSGYLKNITCYSDLSDQNFLLETHPLLYDSTKYKTIYFSNDVLQINSDQIIHRGMIVMHSGITPIPEGWAICDGNTYTYNGITSITPNLIGRFIKAVGSNTDVKEVNNPDLTSTNGFTIMKDHLPKHSHPHKNHTHTITGTAVTITDSNELSMSGLYEKNNSSLNTTTNTVIQSIEDETIITTTSDVINSIDINNTYTDSSITVNGANHTHIAIVTEGTISEIKSEEDEIVWNNKEFNIEPNYYSLIFIMKL